MICPGLRHMPLWNLPATLIVTVRAPIFATVPASFLTAARYGGRQWDPTPSLTGGSREAYVQTEACQRCSFATCEVNGRRSSSHAEFTASAVEQTCQV